MAVVLEIALLVLRMNTVFHNVSVKCAQRGHEVTASLVGNLITPSPMSVILQVVHIIQQITCFTSTMPDWSTLWPIVKALYSFLLWKVLVVGSSENFCICNVFENKFFVFHYFSLSQQVLCWENSWCLRTLVYTSAIRLWSQSAVVGF